MLIRQVCKMMRTSKAAKQWSDSRRQPFHHRTIDIPTSLAMLSVLCLDGVRVCKSIEKLVVGLVGVCQESLGVYTWLL